MIFRDNIKRLWAGGLVLVSLFGLLHIPLSATAVAAPPFLPVDTAAFHDYTYVRFLSERDSAKLTDEEFFDIAGKVIFPINKYTLPKRDSLIMQLEQEVFPLINQDSLELVHLIIRGAASPEGPYRFNKFLGEKRAQVLLDFIVDNLVMPLDENHFQMAFDTEDYRTLCLMMKRLSDKDYAYVQTQCDRYLPKKQIAKLKYELQHTRQGTLWRRLFREYFPRLRAARIVFFFRQPKSYVKKVLPAIGETLIKTPGLAEILKDSTLNNIKPTVPTTVEPVKVEPVPVIEEPEPLIEEPIPIIEEPVPVIEEPLPVIEEPQVIDTTEIIPNLWHRVRRREFLSVKSNLLFDVAYVPGYDRWCPIPNVAIEYYPKHGHFTYGASMDFPWWQHHNEHKFFEIRNYQLEARYYLRSGDIAKNPPSEGIAFRGLYFQGYVHAGLYSICFDADHGWEGEGIGGGLGLGYVMPLGNPRTSHWRLEFGAQFGFFLTKYDPYVFEHPIYKDYKDNLYYYNWIYDPDYFVRRAHRFTWFGPTRVGVTLSYDLLYRRDEKKGISFKPTEWQKE